MRQRNIIKALASMVLLLAIAIVQIQGSDLNKNLKANVFSEFDTLPSEQLLSNSNALIHQNKSNAIAGNVACQSYELTWRCQISAIFSEKDNDLSYSVWAETLNGNLAYMGNLEKDSEGLYLLESILDKQYTASEIIISQGKTKIAEATLLDF